MRKLIDLAAPGVRGLTPYLPGKPIEELERELGVSNIIKLASNENPLGPSPRVLAAIQAVLPELWLYPDGNGFILKAKLSELLGVRPEQITLGSGSSDLLDFAVRAFVTPADEVMFSEHAFAIYSIVTRTAGATARIVPARHWGNDLTAMAQAISERTKLIFIANPNNPTGTWLPGVELEAFLRDLPDHVMVLLDEAYFDYAAHPAMGAVGYPNGIEWVERFPQLIVARTFSKSYGIAGLRVGYGVSHPEVADLLNRVRPPFNVNTLGLVAAASALEDSDHLARTLELNSTGMAQLTKGFGEMGLEFIPSVGNFVSVDVGRPAAPVYDALLREGVIVRPVANYGMPNHLRITVGLPEENQRCLEAMARVLAL